MIEPERKNELKNNKNDQAVDIILEILEAKDFLSENFRKKTTEIFKLLESSCDNLSEMESFKVAYLNRDPMFIVELCLEIFPNNVKLLYYYTECLSKNLEFRRAVPYLRKIVELEPSSHNAWDSLGYNIFKANKEKNSKNLGDPEQCFKKALDLDGTYSEAWLDLGMFYKYDKRFEEAIVCLEKLVELDEGKDFALFQLGHIHQTMGNGDLAMEFYKESLELNPSNDIAWNNLGRVHAERFEFKDAIQMYLRALQFDDGSHVTWENLKYAFMGNEQFDKADYCEKKAFRLKPFDPNVDEEEIKRKQEKEAWYYT
ncbi:MAG: tetratricopeptide repeat protein [Promethearchaeota archaeon]